MLILLEFSFFFLHFGLDDFVIGFVNVEGS